MKLYYNASENIIGITVSKQWDILLEIDPDFMVYRVMSDRWEYIGDL